MIARVAESCFWLQRYVERVDNTARLIGVNFAFLLDVPSDVVSRWKPLLVVSGEEPDFLEQIGDEYVDDGDKVQEFLVWSRDNPVSLVTSLEGARENSRTIRETLSIEAWSVINRFWLWINSEEARALFASQPAVFYDRVREHCQLFHGVCHDTLLHEEPFEFMRLGTFLERAAQVARILDTKYHAVGPTTHASETPVELAEWIAILRSCSAYEPFFKRSNSGLTGRAVADFLIFDPAFPRSIMHCLLRAKNFFDLIGRRREGGDRWRSTKMLKALLADLQSKNIDDILEEGLHDVITEVVDRLARISSAVSEDYFSGGDDQEFSDTIQFEESGPAEREQDLSLSMHSASDLLSRLGGVTQTRSGVELHGQANLSADRLLKVRHDTTYTYDSPVLWSSHNFLLRPVDDERQDLLEYDLELSVDGERTAFEDVFGNQALSFKPQGEFSELRIRSRATVLVRGTAEPARVEFSRSLKHPVIWMPWQRMMMLPHLMPPELPETQLSDLSRFAQQFVERNNSDLVATLRDINQTIHAEFTYEPGSTTVETTPFETFTRREGVCQDFAYLFMCLAQLLNVPARYRVGYIYTGGNYQGQVRSDATHAWAEVYLPQIGWYGFDPANGKATGDVDYVRVASGRHYRDAAPVTGTIFEGGGGERLDISVQVERIT